MIKQCGVANRYMLKQHLKNKVVKGSQNPERIYAIKIVKLCNNNLIIIPNYNHDPNAQHNEPIL